MQLRLSTCAGAPVFAADTREELGILRGVLLQPDAGVLEGIFVESPSLLGAQVGFAHVVDIEDIGPPVMLRTADCLGDPAEVLRVQHLLADPRPLLGQPMVTEDGVRLGVCKDVQVDATTLAITWFFPRKWFRWCQPVERRDVLRVTPKAIIVRTKNTIMKAPHEEREIDVAQVLQAATPPVSTEA